MTFGKYIELFGAVPMITLCFCVAASACETEISYIMIVSVILGAVSDLLGGHGFGTYLFSYTFASFVTYKLKDAVFTSKLLFLIIDAFFMTIIVQVIYRITHIYDMNACGFWHGFISVILPMAIYDTVITLVFYKIHKRIIKR